MPEILSTRVLSIHPVALASETALGAKGWYNTLPKLALLNEHTTLPTCDKIRRNYVQNALFVKNRAFVRRGSPGPQCCISRRN